MNRADLPPITEAIPAARQDDARHYGVHPYFTRRAANVMRAYLERYSRPGDLVLDPFGGSGVIPIEAFLLGRRAIHNDLNPFANFIARNIADTTQPSVAPLREAFERVRAACAEPLRDIEHSEAAARRWLERLPLPANIRLPKKFRRRIFPRPVHPASTGRPGPDQTGHRSRGHGRGARPVAAGVVGRRGQA